MFWWIALSVVAVVIVGWSIARRSGSVGGRGVDHGALRQSQKKDQGRGGFYHGG